ncbi:RluA family pseudouridine synthase [Caldicellulosiruptoraceae bacterium PP1]
MMVNQYEGRIDIYLSEKLEKTRSNIQKLIEDGNIKVNEKTIIKSSLKIKDGDIIEVLIPEPKKLDIVAQNIPFDVIFEDEHLIVINKPKGMVVHPAAGNYENTLVNALLYKFEGKLSDINGVIRPGIVHRIDKDTSGLLIVAKTNIAHLRLSEDLKEHKIKRTYFAITDGIIKEDRGTINAPIGRNPKNKLKMAVVPNGKEAITFYEVLERFQNNTFVKLNLKTGRTHQIRVHLSYIGYPIVGDTVYGKKNNQFNIEGQILHAGEIEFYHPITNELMQFQCEIPNYFNEVLKILRDK